MDKKPSKLTKITKVVVWLMLFVTLFGIVFGAVAALV
ncbi:DUF4044 domain-containing protein [Companilactobacillus sp. RD055328]|nr:DUF4044 domain-containing protein [Companilactobacillus sp. RD055328]